MADNFARRSYDYEMGVGSLVPIETLQTRVGVWSQITKRYAHRARPEAMLPTIRWRATSSVISN